MRKLTAGDVPIAAEDLGGHGRDVLLLHGGGRTRRDWDVFAGLLIDNGFRSTRGSGAGSAVSRPRRPAGPSGMR
ncbi:hypothetical protein GCM10023194_17230 [Planotetraspora phitsanulokensis]|uniref:Alpha/beta hydrolase family protein n=1 Tax=Planotetraspora phitsanulokensis TaxID=575192 RepID=A0A8J3U2U9_9ACTN|nr:hypothetical protein Pph01_00870 [Planotetraspora phitsanulokensis]